MWQQASGNEASVTVTESLDNNLHQSKTLGHAGGSQQSPFHTLHSTECLSSVLLVRVWCYWKPLPRASTAVWKASGRPCDLGGICGSSLLGA